ncbi:anaphase-promoting complex subunit Cut9 [Saxophila tyrrhenica]|uniref:Anaphase-promoting complex subunit Cut9 n=1 Tax=Saxophila tyrrhenica TaxID=1690608 RepID=A0AAV9P4N6_9PEZI|nr:anaphase-promoting complex subunit Cut9 [Saxophila tyrrhenica]
MEAYLRQWQQQCLDRQQWDAAIYVGDKLLALTNSDEDAYALAKIHFTASNYTRALSLVSRSDLLQRSAAAKYLAAHCHVKQNKHDEALELLGEKNPVHLVTQTDSARRKLQYMSNGLSSKQLGKSKLPSRVERADRSEERDHENASNIKFEAGMCYLRGLCYAKQNAFDRAKDCYKSAVRIDIQCFEAFDQLMKNSLMSPGEEWDFVDSLNFDSILADPGGVNTASEAADFTRNLYLTRLSKYSRPEEFKKAIETLSTHYHLDTNPDILLAEAEILYTNSRSAQSLAITSSILELDPYNFACLPLHLALLHSLGHTNALFALSHDLADTHPHEPCSWLAVGTYYLNTGRIPEARSYFSKASLMDPHFGPAWIGFAHTFAAEGEGDQAIAAYSTAARLFQGTHLPQLFLGMQEIALGHLTVAREYLTTAYNLCDRDPLLINELGVIAYLEDDFASAANSFKLALSISADNDAPPSQTSSTRLNLAHALRRSGRFPESLEHFDEVVRLGLRDVGVFAAKGLVLLEMDQAFEATVALHEALAISPQDPVASELLTRALGLLETVGVLTEVQEEGVNVGLERTLGEVRRGKMPRRRRMEGEGEGMDLDGAWDGGGR